MRRIGIQAKRTLEAIFEDVGGDLLRQYLQALDQQLCVAFRFRDFDGEVQSIGVIHGLVPIWVILEGPPLKDEGYRRVSRIGATRVHAHV
jgi:hypothetical protein